MSALPAATQDQYASLAAALQAAGGHGGRIQLLNETLYDVRGWHTLPVDEIAARLAADPLAVCAAWELTEAKQFIDRELAPEAEFLRPFNAPDLLQNMIYLGLDYPDGPLDLPGATVRLRMPPWGGLLFLIDNARWAMRFAHLKPFDVRGLTRINLNHHFPVAVAPLEPSWQEAILVAALKALGVRFLTAAAPVPEHHIAGWLVEQLGLFTAAQKAKQRTLDFKEAGGTRGSFFAVRAMGGVDGVDVRGNVGEDLGLIIDIGDREVSKPATAYLENHVVRIINEHTPLSAELSNGSLRLRWFDARLTAEDLGRIIYQAVKEQFILSVLSVNVIFDPLRVSSLRPSIFAYREEREHELKRRNEEREPFIVCTACRSYAPHAFCVASVDRPPCCGRPFDELATLANLTLGPEQFAIDKGICLDRNRGSYMGAQKMAQVFSESNLQRINLHSIRDYPHPTTAIPQCIVWYLGELEVLGIVSRDFSGRGPDGKTYESLLTRVAGQQVPGYLGVSEAYITSPRFLQAEGGASRIGWMNSQLKNRLKIKADHIATEQDCINMAGLKEYLATWSR